MRKFYDAGSPDESVQGGSDTTNAASTDTNPAAAPASLGELLSNHLNTLTGDDKRAAIIAESDKLLGDVTSLTAGTRNSTCINDIVALQVKEAAKAVEDATTAALDALKETA